MYNYNKITRSGFERITGGITSVLKSFENVHRSYENSTKPIIKKTVRLNISELLFHNFSQNCEFISQTFFSCLCLYLEIHTFFIILNLNLVI